MKHSNSVPTQVQGVTLVPLEKPEPLERPIHIAAIGPAPFLNLHQKKKLEVFSLSLYEINKALETAPDRKESDIHRLVPEHFHEYLNMFEKANADKLPPHRPYDH